ncbi:MAG: linear amide C-N hydrolase [Candidatus Aminicenantes bacterium]|nr:MAG: linear amide C-N hydrolase [Candidatus Aminicenantes bacterium]
MKKNTVFLTAILLLVIAGLGPAQNKVIDLKFGQPPVSDSDTSRTLQSLVKVRAISETYSTGGLYLLTHYGDREELFQKENQRAIDNPMRNQTWRYCSVFSATTDDSVIVGRNWDNQNVGSIIVSLYHPPKGYASISFSRAIDMGFPLNVGLEGFKSSEFGNKLLLAPFYAMDGINEHGLTVSVAGVREISIKPKSDKESVCITFLIRKILDQTKTVEEAVNLVEKYIPFDLDKNSLNCHFFIADSSGRSVVLEYVEDQWKRIYGDKSWQVLTNKPVYNVPDAKLRDQCWRYRSISETLEKTNGNVGWKAGMEILQDVTQKGTTWSVIYSPTTKELYFSVYQNWNIIYHLKTF